jgi:hypothetical protein
MRARLFNVLQEQIRIKREQKSFENLTPAEKINQCRIMEKLQKIRTKVAGKLELSSAIAIRRDEPIVIPTPSSCVGVPKKHRSLKTCAYSVLKFLQKVEVMGEDISSLELEEKHQRIVANVKKRWNVLPSLSVEFAAYYYDREARIETMSKQCKELVKENHELNDKQIALSSALETEAVNQMEVMDESTSLDTQLNQLKGILKKLVPGNKNINNIKGLVPKVKSPRRSPSHSKPTKGAKGSHKKPFGVLSAVVAGKIN